MPSNSETTTSNGAEFIYHDDDGGKSPNDTLMMSLLAFLYDFHETNSNKLNSNSTPNSAQFHTAARQKLFGLSRGLSSDTGSNNRFDYEQRYPRDRPGEELADNARVWLTYLDEADAYDRDKVEGWKETVDVLLVFAGLFSGVITTFVSQASQNLQQNYSQVSASLLFEMVQLQRAHFSGASIVNVPSSTLTPTSSFTPSTNAFLVNDLWFTSLAISLATALIAVLTKQWLYYYMSSVSGTAREKARVRHFRFQGLESWKVGLIVDLLPVFLHLALGVFLLGIIIFLFPLDDQIAWAIIVITGVTFGSYVVSVILPIRYPDCPYTTSLTTYTGVVLFFLSDITRSFLQIAHYFEKSSYFQTVYREFLYWSNIFHEMIMISSWKSLYRETRIIPKISSVLRRNTRTTEDSKSSPDDTVPKFTSWREAKLHKVVQENATLLDLGALSWLYTTCSNPSVGRIIARGVSVHPNLVQEIVPIHELWRALRVEEADLKDLRYGLCMDVQCDYRYRWHFLRDILNEEKCWAQLPEEYQNYSHIAENVIEENYGQIVKDALSDRNLKLPFVMWRHFLTKAVTDATLASCILTSTHPFKWAADPAQTCAYNTKPLDVSFEAEELNRLFFDYLFRCFCHDDPASDLSFRNGKSFGLRYRLLSSVYRSLTSDRSIITDQKQRQRSLSDLFRGFLLWLYRIEPRDVISPEQFFAFQRDILCVNAFWKQPMMDRARQYAFSCLVKMQDHLGCFRVGRVPFIRCERQDVARIYEWCSRADLSETHRRFTSSVSIMLFMPQNRSHLLEEISTDSQNVNATASHKLSKCLQILLYPMDAEYERAKKYVYSSIMKVLKHTHPKTNSFTVLYAPSVLIQVWKLLVHSGELDEKRFLSIVRSKLGRDELTEFCAAITREAQFEQNLDLRRALDTSAGEFKRTVSVTGPCP